MVNIFNKKSHDSFYSTITGFPLPPTVNKQLTRAKFHRGFIKTKVARDFDEAVRLFYIEHSKDVADLAELMQKFVYDGYGFQIDTTFYFPEKKMITKSGNLKRIDASNRIKATHDALAKITNVDDQYIISGRFDKQIAKTGIESCSIKISLIKITYRQE